MNILITGGTGLVGTRLTELLQKNGYQVSHLSRKASNGPIKTYVWNVEKQSIDNEALQKADYIVHLAGAGVFDKPWTDSYKKEIFDSRVNSTKFLVESIKKLDQSPKALISASAIGIYGNDTGTKLITEDSPHGDDFLADVVKHWEQAATTAKDINLRTVLIRIGIVLSKDGGALEKFVEPIKYGAGSPLGNGNQYISWIHIDDLCNLFIYAIENSHMSGHYNGVAPEPVTNKQFITQCAATLKKSLILPNVPSFVLKLVLGSERAKSVLGGNKIAAKRTLEDGFKFFYPNLEPALKNLIG